MRSFKFCKNASTDCHNFAFIPISMNWAECSNGLVVLLQPLVQQKAALQVAFSDFAVKFKLCMAHWLIVLDCYGVLPILGHQVSLSLFQWCLKCFSWLHCASGEDIICPTISVGHFSFGALEFSLKVTVVLSDGSWKWPLKKSYWINQSCMIVTWREMQCFLT